MVWLVNSTEGERSAGIAGGVVPGGVPVSGDLLPPGKQLAATGQRKSEFWVMLLACKELHPVMPGSHNFAGRTVFFVWKKSLNSCLRRVFPVFCCSLQKNGKLNGPTNFHPQD